MTHEGQRLLHYFVEIERVSLRLLARRQTPDTLDDIVGAIGARHDPVREVFDLAHVQIATLQPPKAGLRIRHNGRERLLHLVSDGSGKLAQG